jgi:hypothetical protein
MPIAEIKTAVSLHFIMFPSRENPIRYSFIACGEHGFADDG